MTRFLAEDAVFYHGTYNDFVRFRPLSHFGSIYAAKEMASNGLKKEEGLGGRIVASCTKGLGRIIPVKLKLKNTYELQDVNALHNYRFYSSMLLYHFIKDLGHEKLDFTYDYIVKAPFESTSWENVKNELEKDSLYEVSRNKTSEEASDRYHLFLQRMIHYFESCGFDGFHYVNHFEDKGHISYVPFRPENIIRLDLDNIPNKSYRENNKEFFVSEGKRDLSKVEIDNIDYEFYNKFENSVEKLSLFSEQREALLRPSSFRQILKEKSYYSNVLFSEILPKIDMIESQHKSAFNSLCNIAEVGVMGIDIALSLRQDPLPVLLAVVLWGAIIGNRNSKFEPSDEALARRFLTENYPDLLPFEIESIISAVTKNNFYGPTADLVSACLGDAYKVYFSWLSGCLPDCFATSYGRALASLKAQGYKKYTVGQKRFFIENGIKTR